MRRDFPMALSIEHKSILDAFLDLLDEPQIKPADDPIDSVAFG